MDPRGRASLGASSAAKRSPPSAAPTSATSATSAKPRPPLPPPDDEAPPAISFCRLEVGDVALFMPTRTADLSQSDVSAVPTYLAFHRDCPNRFLARESIDGILATHKRLPDFIIGRVVANRR
mmetsp:Transcript_30846/g.99500  ORF Transcript_30846/g.99500 Transcript_30846/m.99500 type:complete len:123 (-) Transcript_30846:662-1030(-)